MELNVIGLSLEPHQMERWHKMEAVRKNCEELGIETPSEVLAYLEQNQAPREFDLSAATNTYAVLKNDCQESRTEISLKDVPETVETIRIVW